MPYTLIMMNKHSTAGRQWRLNVPRGLFWAFWLLLGMAPVLTFYVTYYYIGITMVGADVAEMAAELRLMDDTLLENTQLTKLNAGLQVSYTQVRSQLAELEARLAIAERTRAEATQQVQSMEQEVFEMRQSLKFYEAFVTPATEQEKAQCFNIVADYDDSKNKLDYRVSFLAAERNNNTWIKANVRLRMITGNSVLNLQDTSDLPVDEEREIQFKQDVSINGSIKRQVPSDVLRVLDIRAYDAEDNSVVAHCWKAF